jgi:YHS domain-containing protein
MNQTATKTNTVIDPVCGMSVNPKTTEIVVTIEGQTYYFCAEGCRQTFVKTPKKYLEPRPEKKKGWWCRYTQRLEKATGGKAMKCH